VPCFGKPPDKEVRNNCSDPLTTRFFFTSFVEQALKEANLDYIQNQTQSGPPIVPISCSPLQVINNNSPDNRSARPIAKIRFNIHFVLLQRF
jgi:hypothetical protein